MGKEGRTPVRAFPMRMVILASCAMVIALGMLGWTAYDGFRQSRATKQLVTSAQSLQFQLITMQQNLSAMLIMASATGDIRWSRRYTIIVDDLTTLVETAKAISEEFSSRVDRVVFAGIGIAQVQGEVVQLLSENQVEKARDLVLGPSFQAKRDIFETSLENLGREIQQLTTKAQHGFERRFLWSAIGAISVLVLSAVVWIIAAKRLREWRRALDGTMDEIDRYEAELESRVAERTQAFEDAEQRLRVTVDNMSGGILMVDRDLNLQVFNNRLIELYDLPKELVRIGNPLEGILKLRAERGEYGAGNPDEQAAQRVAEYRENPNARREDYIATNKRSIEIYRSELADGSIVAVFNDITDRKRAAELLERANKLTRDSIQYASRIQRSLLPGDDVLGDMFAEHFCIWQPRDVVGGDMYWVRQDRRGYFVALFDCTGHGVPGALMTTIAVSALNVAFAETADPSRLIARVNQIIKEALAQQDDSGQGEEGASDDGLEMGICLVEPERMRVTFAGARFELLSAVGDHVEVIKGDRSSLGYRHVPSDRRFTNHSIRLHSGQQLYMYTDGIMDQVGGNRRRSFGRKRILKLLGDVAHMPMRNQGEAIVDALSDYQGSETRRDDVSMIGFMPIH